MSEQVKCPKCGGPGILLFIHIACDTCDGVRSSSSSTSGTYNVGYAIFRGRPSGSCEYVFKTYDHAQKWRDAAGLQRFQVKEVRTKSPLVWTSSSGSVKGIEYANRLFEMFPDSSHEPGPNRAYWVD